MESAVFTLNHTIGHCSAVNSNFHDSERPSAKYFCSQVSLFRDAILSFFRFSARFAVCHRFTKTRR